MKIFIIADEQISIFLTRGMLAQEGFTKGVETFMSAIEALQALRESMPDIILLDLNMTCNGRLAISGYHLGFRAGLYGKVQGVYFYFLAPGVGPGTGKAIPMYSGLLHKPIRTQNIKYAARQ